MLESPSESFVAPPGQSSTRSSRHEAVPSIEQPKSEGTDKKLYPVVWRWHFYAGLLTAPILWVVTLTGAIYVFKTELTELRDRHLLFVTPQEERKSYDDLKAIAAAAHGSDELEAVVLYPEADRSVTFIGHVAKPGHESSGEDDHGHGAVNHKFIHVNPYTGEVLGTQIAENDLFSIVLDLHRTLFMGTTGRILTELVTCWGILLLATGVFLWWPRGKKNVGVWLPRVKGTFYALLRDWHAVPGVYITPIILIIAATGLWFTVVWGTGFNTTAQKMGHWPKEWFQNPKSVRITPDARPVSLDQVIPTFLANSRPGDKIPIRFASKPDDCHRAFMIQGEDKNTFHAVSVDQYSGELINVMDVADLPLMFRIRVWSVSIHMGQIFGMPTKILALLASLMLFALSFTGIWMWWKRRPKGRSGFPRRPQSRSLPKWGWGVIVLLGVVMPVAGVSILLISLGDFLWNRFRRPRPAQA